MGNGGHKAHLNGRDNIIVQASGGASVVVGAQPYLKLTLYQRRTALAARGNSETSRLSAYRDDIVRLIGRGDDMAGLREWLDAPNPVSTRVLIGPGGRGKTRLACELARAVSKTWLAGFAPADEFDRFRAQARLEAWGWDKPVLVIIDYAASRAEPLAKWVRELVDASLDGRPRFRLLLLERQARTDLGWFATVFGLGYNDASRAARALLDPPEPRELPPLDDAEGRREIFAATFGQSSPAPGADREFDRLIAERKWAGDPLYLLMAGLVAASGGGIHAALSLSRVELADWAADRELARIGAIAAARGIDPLHERPGAFVRHMAAMATLTQGLVLAEARALARAELAAPDLNASVDLTLAALRDALPGAGEGIAPILPDIVGEAAILAAFADLSALGVPAEPRIAAAAKLALKPVSETLVRAAQDFPASGRIEPVRWLEALANGPETEVGTMMQIADALPQSTLALREVAAGLYLRISEMFRGNLPTALDADEAFLISLRFGLSLNNLGTHLSGLGRREDALAAAREAVDVFCRLAADRPMAFLPDLAGSLNNLGNRLSDLGRREDALAAAREAVKIHRRLAADRPAAFLPDLAMSLSNLGNCLNELGLREDALEAAREAVEIRRGLAADRPDAFLPDLAASLSNFGNHLSDLGRREDALGATREAVEIRRRLTADRSDAFLPDLAGSLNNLGVRLSELGLREDALAVSQEAVEIRRRLAADRPAAFLPHLAGSLNNLGIRLSILGRRDDALAATREAVEIRRRLAADRPAAFLPDLAASLDNFGNRLSELGLREDALTAVREATDIYRRLAADRPAAFLPDFAMSLNNLGIRLSEVGRREDALPAAREAVEIRRGLAADRPDAFLPDLAGSLGTLGNVLEELGLHDDALGAIREAMMLFAPFFLRLPRAHARWMTIMCRLYIERSERAGVEPDAAMLAPITEALQRLQADAGEG
jgi:tetratricopeptide (TPR) repeat protein